MPRDYEQFRSFWKSSVRSDPTLLAEGVVAEVARRAAAKTARSERKAMVFSFLERLVVL